MFIATDFVPPEWLLFQRSVPFLSVTEKPGFQSPYGPTMDNGMVSTISPIIPPRSYARSLLVFSLFFFFCFIIFFFFFSSGMIFERIRKGASLGFPTPRLDQLESPDKAGLRKKQRRNNYCSRGGKFIREKVTPPFLPPSRTLPDNPKTLDRVIFFEAVLIALRAPRCNRFQRSSAFGLRNARVTGSKMSYSLYSYLLELCMSD